MASSVFFQKRITQACLLMLFLFFSNALISQDVGEPEKVAVTRSEWTIELFLNTAGGGLGFQQDGLLTTTTNILGN
jgi:hypothetical protein